MIKLRINNNIVDLYGDETIEVRAQVKAYSSISTIWADFSQSFKVPASGINNDIFRHYYNANVVDGGSGDYIDWRIKQRASIDVLDTRYLEGFIKLETMDWVEGEIESYTLTFFGTLVALKDIFGDRIISDLNLTQYDHDRNSLSVKAGMDAAGSLLNDTVIYPLISKSNKWVPADFTGISYTEFSPAVQVYSLIKNIETEFGLTFVSDFFEEAHFKALYLYCPRELTAEDLGINPEEVPLELIDPATGPYANNIIDYFRSLISMLEYNNSTDKDCNILMEVATASTPEPYTISMYRVTSLGETFVDSFTSSNAGATHSFHYVKAPGIDESIRFYIGTEGAVDISIIIRMEFQTRQNDWYDGIWWGPAFPNNTEGSNMSLGVPDSEMRFRIPTLKISDFFFDIARMFNLMIDSQKTGTEFEQGTYYIEPYDVWLENGRNPTNTGAIDLTDNIDISNTNIRTASIPKALTYKYQDPEAILNARYSVMNEIPYGDVTATTVGGAEAQDVEVVFENLLWSRLTSSEFLVADCFEEVGKPLESKSMLMYWAGQKAGPIEITGQTAFANYKFCNSYYSDTTPYTHSLNFDSERDAYTTFDQSVSLISLYHLNFLDNLLSPSNRGYTFKAHLSTVDILDLKLNDSLKIKDNYFITNSIKSNLLTGEVTIDTINRTRGIGDDLPPPYDNEPPVVGNIFVLDNPDSELPIIGALNFVEKTQDRIRVSWTAATDNIGVTQYNIYVSEGLGSYSLWATYSGSSLVGDAQGLESDTEYNIKITAEDALGNESLDSNIVTQTTDAGVNTIPPTVGVLTDPPSNITSNSMLLTWSMASGVDPIASYQVYVNYSLVHTVTAPILEYQLTGLASGQFYDIYITATDTGNLVSDDSNLVVTSTLAQILE